MFTEHSKIRNVSVVYILYNIKHWLYNTVVSTKQYIFNLIRPKKKSNYIFISSIYV